MISFGPVQWAIAAATLVAVVVGCRRLSAGGLGEWRAGLVIALLGVGGFCIGAAELWKSWRLVHGANHAPGVVDAVKISTSTDNQDKVLYWYSPVVRFRARESDEVTEFTASSYSSSRFSRGDEVEVFYPPGHPEEARLNDFGDLWMCGLMWLVLSLPEVLASVIALVLIRMKIVRVRPVGNLAPPA